MYEDGSYCEDACIDVVDDARETAQSAPVGERVYQSRRTYRLVRSPRRVRTRSRRPAREWHAPIRAQAPPG